MQYLEFSKESNWNILKRYIESLNFVQRRLYDKTLRKLLKKKYGMKNL